MKQSEFTNCATCGKGMAKGIFFYRVRVEQFILDTGAIQRQHGLEMAMGRAAPLAGIMGPDEDLATGMGEHTALICGECGISYTLRVAMIIET
jgi:hypothetical protein